jgi:hypothetical protein
MLTSVFVVSIAIWLLGVAMGSMLGGFIHVFLLVAIAAAGIGIIQRRRVASEAKQRP